VKHGYKCELHVAKEIKKWVRSYAMKQARNGLMFQNLLLFRGIAAFAEWLGPNNRVLFHQTVNNPPNNYPMMLLTKRCNFLMVKKH
jgi:hypothetical protein